MWSSCNAALISPTVRLHCLRSRRKEPSVSSVAKKRRLTQPVAGWNVQCPTFVRCWHSLLLYLSLFNKHRSWPVWVAILRPLFPQAFQGNVHHVNQRMIHNKMLPTAAQEIATVLAKSVLVAGLPLNNFIQLDSYRTPKVPKLRTQRRRLSLPRCTFQASGVP